MQSEGRLEDLQQWMQAVVVSREETEAACALASAASTERISSVEDVILPSSTLAPAERVAIYHRMYLLRMMEALESDFPCIEHFVGHGRFHKLVADYVEVFPSRSYTLNRLGDHLPDFIQSDESLRHRSFLYDLARLELAVTHAYDASPANPVTPELIAAVPDDGWDRARLRPVPSLQLMAFRYPVSEYLESVQEDLEHPSTTRKDSWYAIYRRGLSVRRLELSRRGFHLLLDLREGKTLGESLARLARKFRRGVSEDELFSWFRDWTANGIFSSVEI
ncbi:MAG TPA: DNA-binding domain-containing protein [Thermoanaerobaculia bacterium]|nr:DNA-binding domain-containing protein [Thermoanaerobaculia bacterium]